MNIKKNLKRKRADEKSELELELDTKILEDIWNEYRKRKMGFLDLAIDKAKVELREIKTQEEQLIKGIRFLMERKEKLQEKLRLKDKMENHTSTSSDIDTDTSDDDDIEKID